jgi:AraC-like DNA-binding protein
MLYLLHKQGESFATFISNLVGSRKDVDFRVKIESESLNKLTLEEMAFLCNMSLSTFKRNFLNTYGISPQKWFQNKRLQFAYEALKNNSKTPSDLYLELGYSSLSSFSTAFTNIFGVPPTKVLQKNDHL